MSAYLHGPTTLCCGLGDWDLVLDTLVVFISIILVVLMMKAPD